ncbi:hypothetical protein D3C81_2064800 [compost metagenome]
MTAKGIGEHGAPGLVVDLARIFRVSAVVVETVARIPIPAIGTAIEVAQVGFETLAIAYRQDVYEAKERLLVKIFKLRMVCLNG